MKLRWDGEKGIFREISIARRETETRATERKTTSDTKYKTPDSKMISFSKPLRSGKQEIPYCPRKLHGMRALTRKSERYVDSIRLSTDDSSINYTTSDSEESVEASDRKER